MRIFTCTPVAFGGGPDFFARDSGLWCRGFQALGIESRAVMPGLPRPDDEADLIRTDIANLKSSTWWREQQLDAVVLYAWGSPRYRAVARAIHDAGIFLLLNQDSSGWISPLAGPTGWLAEQWRLTGQGRSAAILASFVRYALRGISIGLLATDPLRASHLHNGDVIGCVSPEAAVVYQRLCRIYGGAKLASRVTVLPHPVEPRFFHIEGQVKRKQIACVGRWDDEIQKRPRLMARVIEATLTADPEANAVIAGKPGRLLHDWHQALAPSVRCRIKLLGVITRDAMTELFRESQVFYSSSAYESFGIAAAEALCCGCSVVAGRSRSLTSFQWFVGDGDGQLAESDCPHGHVAALNSELSHWAAGERDPAAISARWRARLHADKVAAGVVDMLDARRPGRIAARNKS